jgi:hypothetical protein
MGFCVQLVHSGRIGQYPSLIDSHAFNKSQNKKRADSCIWRFGCVPVILPNPDGWRRSRWFHPQSPRAHHWRLKVGVVDDVECIDAELKLQALKNVEVF